MRTFEYKFIYSERLLDLIGRLSAAGKEGWEIICPVPDSGRSYSYLAKRAHGSDEPDIRINGAALHVSLADADAAASERGRLVPRFPPDPNTPWGKGPHIPTGALGPRERLYKPAVDGSEA